MRQRSLASLIKVWILKNEATVLISISYFTVLYLNRQMTERADNFLGNLSCILIERRIQMFELTTN